MAQGAASVLAWGIAGVPAAPGAAWHAHEMIFGHALAVVGGYLLTRLAAWPLLAIAAAWGAARLIIPMPAATEEVRAALSIAATGAIALPAALAFLRGVKRPGNLVFPMLLGGFVAADALFQLGELGALPWATESAMRLALGLVLMLIAAMGGRLIGAAASGAAQRSGGARIPPRPGLEGALLALLAAGIVAEAFAALRPAGPALLAAGGMLLLVRVVLWVPGLRQGGADILALAAGQVWLGLGLIVWMVAAMGLLPVAERGALHLAAIGGIGSTLLVMMMRTAAQREGLPTPRRAAPAVAGLMGAAALVRACGPPDWAWTTAAGLWTAATLVAAAAAAFGGPRR